jgi:hypothetical protein
MLPAHEVRGVPARWALCEPVQLMHAPREVTVSERARLTLGRAWPFLSLLLLSFLLFAPRYFTSDATFFPLPGEHPRWLRLLLNRDNLDVFRFSVDVAVLVVLALWSAGWPRLQRPVRVLCTTLYVALWVFVTYHHAVAHFYERKPAISEDIRLALNLWHFVSGYALYGFAAVAAFVLLLGSLSWLTARTLRELQRKAAGWPRRRKLLVSAALVVPGLLSIGWFGTKRDEPTIQLVSRLVGTNIRTSLRERRRLAQMRSSPPDLRYEPFSQVKLKQKPDVYLFMLEAYGEILSTWDMNDAYQALMTRVQEKLGGVGYHAATAYSNAPVHGGTSWFSISTVHTGIQIDRPQAYEALQQVSARIPSLTRFFREQGYLTHALQPGVQLRSGMNRHDMFNHEVPVDSFTLEYHGPQYGWGYVPDQYSIGLFRERYFQPIEGPRYTFYMGVSTHYIWENVPHYVRDWKTLQEPSPEAADYDDSWPTLPAAATRRIATDMRRNYFRSVAYEWRLLTEWFVDEAKRGNVILVIGDHQPRLEWDPPGGVNMNTPVHIISQDAALVERFKTHGFQDGMYAQPHVGPSLQHAGLFSLFVSEVAGAYATEDSPKLEYYPQGLPLAGLNR